MSNALDERFSISTETSAGGSYLVIRWEEDISVPEYQVEMLLHNPGAGILPIDLRRVNHVHAVYYEIGDRVTLSKLAGEKRMTRQELLRFLSGIVKTLRNSFGYLLYSDSFLLHEDFVYVNPTNMEPALVYLPVIMNQSAGRSLKSFFLNLIMVTLDVDTGDDTLFLQRLIGMIKKREGFHLKGFEKALEELTAEISRDDSGDKSFKESGRKAEGSSPRAGSMVQEQREGGKAFAKIPDQKKTNRTEAKSPEATGKGGGGVAVRNYHGLRAGVLLQIIIITILLTLYFTDALLLVGEDKNASLGAVCLIMGAMDIFILKKIVKREDIPASVDKFIPTAPRSAEKMRSVNPLPIPLQEGVEVDDALPSPLPPEKTERVDDTVLLANPHNNRPYLLTMKDGVESRIIIDKPCFIIGRLVGKVDYVTLNKAIGKVHAEVLTTVEGHFLKDRGSGNGSFINEFKLKSNIEYPLKDGDNIILANEQYLFKAP